MASRASLAVLVGCVLLAGACGGDDEAAPGTTTVTTTPPDGGETTTTEVDGDPTTTTTQPTTTLSTTTTTTVVTDPSGPDIQLFTLPQCDVIPGGALSGADVLNIAVAVRNGGPGPLDRLVPVVADSDTGLSARADHAISTGSAFSSVQVDLSSGAYGVSHRFTITADPENEITERDEANNSVVVTAHLPSSRPAEAEVVTCTSP